MLWEGAELYYYYNEESHGFELSDAQFAIIAKILGLEVNSNGEISCYSDETLKQFLEMKENPLRLKKR